MALLIGRLTYVPYTARGATYLIRRLGYTPQVPAHRAVERDEQQITHWRESRWPEIKG